MLLKKCLLPALIAIGTVAGAGAASASADSHVLIPRGESSATWARQHDVSGNRRWSFVQVPTSNGLQWQGTYEQDYR
jgi:hypothetical protein